MISTEEEEEEERKQKLVKDVATQHIESSARSNVLTRSKPFKALVNKAFVACDLNKSGNVSRSELYSSLLFVHITLARYAGPAACFPPSREVSDQLFEAADVDNSNGIDKIEFESILVCCCAQILSRMLVYYSVLLLFVPWFARHVIDSINLSSYMLNIHIPNGSYLEMAANQTISISIFMGAIPLLWNVIDAQTTKTIIKRNNNNNSTAATTCTSTSKSDTDKKDE